MAKKPQAKKQVKESSEESFQIPFPQVFFERGIGLLDDLGAIIFAAAGLVALLGLFGLTGGTLIDPFVLAVTRWFGLGAFLFPLVMFLASFVLIQHRRGHTIGLPWVRIIALEIAVFCILGLLSIIDGVDLPRAEAGLGGGIVGWGLARLFGDLLGGFGTILLLSIILLPALLIGLHPLMMAIMPEEEELFDDAKPMSVLEIAGEQPSETKARLERQRIRSLRDLPREYRKQFHVMEPEDEAPARPIKRDRRLPPLELLASGRMSSVSSKEINLAAGLIEKTLADFGIPTRVVDFKTGPAVTQFALEPGYVETTGPDGEVRRSKVRVSAISGLANDLALALSAPRLRIEAPVPGHPYMGIEVPNRQPALVRLRPILETEAYQGISGPLAIALGRDVAGEAVAADLGAMPHLLIAGTTGSGKSVCIASLTVCLAMNNHPDDLRMVMIDPKMVELIRFNGLPHLVGRVETDLERIVGVLRWCTKEMDRRYKLLETARARDIASYNQKVRRRREGEPLPQLVILIDELADLMMMAPDQTEHTLVRLAQMARATGIHLVVATQRPSTDILTGLIKANFPARISFAVASSVDSRVILDTQGAETLLGQGDMLYLSPEASAPVRLQGAFVSDKEIENLIRFWQSQDEELEMPEEEQQDAPWEELLLREAALEDRDEILEEAIELVKRRGEASASMLQRALRVGYPRAARLMDELEELGVVGRAQSGGRTREVLIDEGEDPLASATDEEEDE
ncbi:MAG: DNA translocase FtsK [Anaerolineales bacterium]|jgi:S-DNA-T family DNA segregation ATPase FtsK/SpoIIIE